MKFCTKCGAALNDGGAFCPNCGTAVPVEAKAEPKQEKKKNNKKTGKIIALLVAVALVLAAIPTGWFVIKKLKTEKTGTEAEATIELVADKNQVFVDAEEQTVAFFAKTDYQGEYLILVDNDSGREVARLYDDGKMDENGDKDKNDDVFSGQIGEVYQKETTLNYTAKLGQDSGAVSSNTVSISVVTDFSDQQLEEMETVDEACSEILREETFDDLSVEEKKSIVEEKLAAFTKGEAGESLIQEGSVCYDENAQLFSFRYANGVLGGVSIAEPDPRLAQAGGVPDNAPNSFQNLNTTTEGKTANNKKATAIIMYGWNHWGEDAELEEFYTACKNEWTSSGLETTLSTSPTVATYQTELKNQDFIVFATHGSRYTYNSGFLWMTENTYSVLCTLEEVTKENKKTYKKDLNQHRIASVTVEGGITEYWILPCFFEHYYANCGLKNAIVYMDNCKGFGEGQLVDYDFAWALDNGGGASTVIGYYESVYIAYGAVMMVTIVDELLNGKPISEALTAAKKKWGENDLEYAKNKTDWDTTGRTAAYSVLSGKSDTKLSVQKPVDYQALYDAYLASDEWRSVTSGLAGQGSIGDHVNIKHHKIFDLDGDGVPELWYKVTSDDMGPRGPESASGFCTILDGKVERLLSGYECGGSAGGDDIVIRYDTETSKHVVGLEGYSGGFGGSSADCEYYDFHDGLINKIVSTYTISQDGTYFEKDELKDSSLYYIEEKNPYDSTGSTPYITIYKVNDIQTKKENYEKARNRFVNSKDDKYKLKMTNIN